MHSQYEEEIILEYFKDQNPIDLSFLDIGANDGITFSNTHQLAILTIIHILINIILYYIIKLRTI